MRSMARAVVRVGDPHDSYRKWYNSTSSCAACAGWVWKGDCSSDEVVGHVFAWAILGHVHPSAQDQAKSAHYLERLIGTIPSNARQCCLESTQTRYRILFNAASARFELSIAHAHEF